MFEWIKENENNFSKWYPKVKDCGIRQPVTAYFDVPEELIEAFFMTHDEDDRDKIYNWVKTELIPQIPDNLRNKPVFVKNGTFSNKFDFKTCATFTEPCSLTSSLIEINYNSFLFDAGGANEVVVRERIPYDARKTPCIYNGMPLRNEFRVFYDFDKHAVLYAVNYWDYDYCIRAIRNNATDLVVFDAMQCLLTQGYNENVDSAVTLVDMHMKNVDLKGKWSIDIMMTDEGFWLIDMAVAEQSAYWDPTR